MARAIGQASGTASAGTTASTKTTPNPARSASQGATGTRTNWGTAPASPRAPIARPRRPGSTRAAIAVAPQTVTMPNPSPRTAASAVTAHRLSVARFPSAGNPSSPDPSTSVHRHPRPGSTRRIVSWASTVQTIMAPVTSPAPRPSLPPRITHSGATGSSSANPENHSVAEPSSQRMPGTRQTEPASTPFTSPFCSSAPRTMCMTLAVVRLATAGSLRQAITRTAAAQDGASSGGVELETGLR